MWRFLIAFLEIEAMVCAGLYRKNSPVLTLNYDGWNNTVLGTNHTMVGRCRLGEVLTNHSIKLVKFYAPWCRHSMAMKAVYETAARYLKETAVAAAIDCEYDENESICRQMGIEAFPTLKIFTPSNSSKTPSAKDYKGKRSAKTIVAAVHESIVNHLDHIKDGQLEAWLDDHDDKLTVVYFSPTKQTKAVIKLAAIDLLSSVKIAQISGRHGRSIDDYGVPSIPALMVYPSSNSIPVFYSGSWSRKSVLNFLVAAIRETQSTDAMRAPPISKSSGSPAVGKPSSHGEDRDSQTSRSRAGSYDNTTTIPRAPLDDFYQPKSLREISSLESLQNTCLRPNSELCVLILLPLVASSGSQAIKHQAIVSQITGTFSEVLSTAQERHHEAIPTYTIKGETDLSYILRVALGLKSRSNLEILALHARRNCVQRYGSQLAKVSSIEEFLNLLQADESATCWTQIPELLLLDETWEERSAGGSDDAFASSSIASSSRGREASKSGSPDAQDTLLEAGETLTVIEEIGVHEPDEIPNDPFPEALRAKISQDTTKKRIQQHFEDVGPEMGRNDERGEEVDHNSDDDQEDGDWHRWLNEL